MRDITSDVIAELIANSNRPVLLFDGEFGDDYVRINTSIKDLVFEANTYYGNGLIKSFRNIVESTGMNNNNISVEFVGTSTDIMSYALNGAKQSDLCSIYLGFLNSSDSLILDPILMFSGYLSNVLINRMRESTNIIIEYSSGLRTLEDAPNYRYTNEDQKIFYPSDRGFEYVNSIVNWTGYWGKQDTRDYQK